MIHFILLGFCFFFWKSFRNNFQWCLLSLLQPVLCVCMLVFIVEGLPLWLESQSLITVSLFVNSLLLVVWSHLSSLHIKFDESALTLAIWFDTCNAICLPAVLCWSYLTLPYLPHPSVRVPLASEGIPFLNKSIQLINRAEPSALFAAECNTPAFSVCKRHLKTAVGPCRKTKDIWEVWILGCFCVELWNKVRRGRLE